MARTLKVIDKLIKKLFPYVQKTVVFDWIRRFLQRHFNLLEVRLNYWVSQDPFEKNPPFSQYKPKYPFTIGIIKEFYHLHWHYIAACEDLGVAYKVLDISGPDWLEVVKESGCDAFLVKPSVHLSIWKQMYDDRLRIMVKELKKFIFPSYDELWLWESKRRMYYWLQAKNLPHPRTWIFYNRKEALEFAQEVDLPVIFKSDMGSSAIGVILFHDRRKLKRHINACFNKGLTTYMRGPLDKEWGSVLFQEYIPDAREWRAIRIGRSFFAYEKLKRGDFHSGAGPGAWRYSRPPSDLLNLVKKLTDESNFLSMGVDVLISKNNELLINELQTIVGMYDPSIEPNQCEVDGVPGRMYYDEVKNSWEFEPGDFCRNYLCNLRVLTLLELLGKR
jgi:hypothetical protein